MDIQATLDNLETNEEVRTHYVKAHWCITVDHLEGVEKISEKTPDMIIPIRLYDDDNELYYSGWMTQHLMDDGENAFEPLDWATWNAGCTYMKYKEPGKDWKVL